MEQCQPIPSIIYLQQKGDENVHPFKLFIEFAASIGKFMDQLSDMTDYPVRLLKGIAAIGLVIAILEDCMINRGEHAMYIAMALIALVRL